jgi:hypothetical protein
MAFETCLQGNVFAEVGKITGEKAFKVHGLRENMVIRADILDLKEAWKRPLRF